MLDDLASYADGHSIGAVGTNLFKSYLPDDPVNAVVIRETGGPQPSNELPIKKPTFQVEIRNTSYSAGRAKLSAVRALFHGINSTMIGSTFFFYIEAISEGGHLGRDDNGNELFSINFLCETR